jgi:transcriptional regulator with XRE-family HTH domain
MPLRFKKDGPLNPHFLAAWREKIGWSREHLAEMMGTTSTSVWRVENLEYGYSQAFIEQAAACMKKACGRIDVAALISRNPAAQDELDDLIAEIRAFPMGRRETAIEVMKALVRSPPVPPESAPAAPKRKRPPAKISVAAAARARRS